MFAYYVFSCRHYAFTKMVSDFGGEDEARTMS